MSAKDVSIRAALLELLAERGEKTACPSEVARRVGGESWRPLMPAVRAVATALQRSGRIAVTQRGREVNLAEARGPVRLRLRLRQPAAK